MFFVQSDDVNSSHDQGMEEGEGEGEGGGLGGGLTRTLKIPQVQWKQNCRFGLIFFRTLPTKFPTVMDYCLFFLFAGLSVYLSVFLYIFVS